MSTDFTLNAHEVIEKGIRLSGGNPSQAEELKSAITTLNLLQQEWTTRGINLWKLSPEEISVSSSTASIPLDSSYIDIVDAVVRTTGTPPSSTTDYQLERIGFKDYMDYTYKDQYGRPTQYAVERLKDAPRLTLWPVPDDDSYKVYAWVLKKFDDVVGPSGGVDAPAKYLPALCYGLGYYMAVERSDGSAEWENKLNRLENKYNYLWNLAFDEDQERGSFKVVPCIG